MTFMQHNRSILSGVVATLIVGCALCISSCSTTRLTAANTAPEWAPTAAGDLSDVEYYSFPDYGIYYDAGTGRY
jgi:hypothetical protein